MSWLITGAQKVNWDPSLISTALWLDGADGDTVFSDAGVTKATNGSTVQQWNDKSGNGRNVSQATSANRPTYSTNVINSRSVVDCGADDFLITTAVHGIGTTSVIAAVIRPNTLSGLNKDYVTGGIANNNGDTHILYHQPSVPVGLNLYSGNGLFGSNVLAVNTTSIAIGVTNGINSSIRHNGSIIATGNAGSQNWNAGFIIGRSAAATNYVDAKYAEVVVIAGASNTLDIQKLEGYLAHKWGLTANLPADHPYKTAVPAP